MEKRTTSGTKKSPISHAEIGLLAREYHQVQSEHQRSNAEGSGRRHLHARMRDIERRFERLLAHGVSDEADREAWRAHMHHAAPAPASPAAAGPLLLFKGRADSGSTLEVRKHADGKQDVFVDGAPIERVGPTSYASPFRIDRQEYNEVFDTTPHAFAVLRGYVTDPKRQPPWRYAMEIIEDGLVDGDFGLTERGRRAMALRS